MGANDEGVDEPAATDQHPPDQKQNEKDDWWDDQEGKNENGDLEQYSDDANDEGLEQNEAMNDTGADEEHLDDGFEADDDAESQWEDVDEEEVSREASTNTLEGGPTSKQDSAQDMGELCVAPKTPPRKPSARVIL